MASECDDDTSAGLEKNPKTNSSSMQMGTKLASHEEESDADLSQQSVGMGKEATNREKNGVKSEFTRWRSGMQMGKKLASHVEEDAASELDADLPEERSSVGMGKETTSRGENGVKSELDTGVHQRRSGMQMDQKLTSHVAEDAASELDADLSEERSSVEMGKETTRRGENGAKSELDTGVPNDRHKSVISVTFNNIKDHVMQSKPKKRRLLGKKGGLKVRALHVEQKGGLYFSDLFTTLVDCDWRWIIVIFASCFIGSWIVFGLLWLAVAKSRSLHECIDNVDSFASALLFSIETQTTIGFGSRAVTPACPDAIIILIAQSLIGLLMSAFLLGLVFTKLARPSRRADTLLFSKNALIAPRDGRLCLLFRVGDIRESRILDAQVRVQLFRTRHTAEGHEIPFYQQDLKCGIDWSDKGSGNHSLFLVLPLTIIHVIDEDSPFYEMNPEDFNSKANFEMVAVLEGVIESTSMLVEARTSYLGDEIFWGRDFSQVLHEDCWDDIQGRYLVDFSLFHGSIPVELPMVSAKEFYSRKQDDEVQRSMRKARVQSRRIMTDRSPRQEDIVKQYTMLWQRKFASIQEDRLPEADESAPSNTVEEDK